MGHCDLCDRPATRTADKWFQFPRDPQRLAALCEPHWEELLTALERPWHWVAPSRPTIQDRPMSLGVSDADEPIVGVRSLTHASDVREGASAVDA